MVKRKPPRSYGQAITDGAGLGLVLGNVFLSPIAFIGSFVVDFLPGVLMFGLLSVLSWYAWATVYGFAWNLDDYYEDPEDSDH